MSYAITASSKIEGAMCGIQLGNHVAPSLLELNGRYSKDKIIRQGDRVMTTTKYVSTSEHKKGVKYNSNDFLIFCRDLLCQVII